MRNTSSDRHRAQTVSRLRASERSERTSTARSRAQARALRARRARRARLGLDAVEHGGRIEHASRAPAPLRSGARGRAALNVSAPGNHRVHVRSNGRRTSGRSCAIACASSGPVRDERSHPNTSPRNSCCPTHAAPTRFRPRARSRPRARARSRPRPRARARSRPRARAPAARAPAPTPARALAPARAPALALAPAPALRPLAPPPAPAPCTLHTPSHRGRRAQRGPRSA
jgi:hypothetical protein